MKLSATQVMTMAVIVLVIGAIAGVATAQGFGARKQALADAMKADRNAVAVALAETIQEEIPTAPARKAFVDTLFAKLGLDIVADTRTDAHLLKDAIEHLRDNFDVTETNLTTIVGMLGEKPEPEGAGE